MIQGTYGFRISVTTNINLSTATAIAVKIKRPGGAAMLSKTMASDGVTIDTPATGVISFPVIDGDLNNIGTYKIQVWDTTPGRLLKSTIGEFAVSKSL